MRDGGLIMSKGGDNRPALILLGLRRFALAAAPPAQAPAGAAPEFDFKGQKVRVAVIEGELWFMARDVGVLLFDPAAIRRSGVAQYLGNLAADEKQTLSAANLATIGLINGGVSAPGRMSLISESGLYKLVMRSDKPEAKAFQDWVTRDVLPSIRKTGSYAVPAATR